MFRVKIAAPVLIGGLFLLCSCNTGPMFKDRQGSQGPEVSPTALTGTGTDTSAVGNDLALIEAEEVDLVEAVLNHRAMYHRALRQLRDYYERRGYATKLSWAEFELKGLSMVKPFRYLLDAEIPAESLRPVESIAEADKLYGEGVELMRRGGHGVPAIANQKMMVQAAGKFRALIEQYPRSDKIDDAAFYMGELHKEYFEDQELLAVKWYERAWTWNPGTPHPARFQAAVVYDYRLHDRARALELYHAVLEHETADEKNARFATRRIGELSSEVSQGSPRAISRQPGS
jgi:hypothetical protein